MRKVLALTIIFTVIFIQLVFASEVQIKRTQTVYSVLDWNGKVIDTSIVNWIRANGKGKFTIEDNPELENLTILDPELRPEVENKKVLWNIESEGVKDIFYTGSTTKSLPIKTSIFLKLNGQDATPEQMLGKSGNVDLSFEFENLMSSDESLSWVVGNTTKYEKKTIYQPMTIIVQADFPVESFDELKSEKAFSMTVGSHKKLMWTLFPKPKEKISIYFSSNKITIPSVQISIQPTVPDIPLPEIDDNMLELMGLFSGDDEIFDLLEQGMPVDSKKALDQITKTKSLMDASKILIEESKKQLNDFTTSFANLENGLREMQSGSSQLVELTKGHKKLLETMKTNFDQNQNGFDEAIKGVQDAYNSTGKVSRDLFSIRSQLEEIRDGINSLKPFIVDKDAQDKANALESTTNNAISKIDSIKTDEDKAILILKTLINGGVLNGKTVPALSTMPENLALLGQVLNALIGGGEVMGQQLLGLNTTIDGLTGISEGLKTIIEGSQVNGVKTPPLSSIPDLISESSSKMDVLVEGGMVNGIKVPSQKETLQMIDDFKKMLEDFAPMQDKLAQMSEKLNKIIQNAGSRQNLVKSMQDTQELLFSGTAEMDKMKQKEAEYRSFIGNTPNAANSLLFVIKMKEINIEDSKKKTISIDMPKSDVLYSDINKYKYYILYSAILLIIASFIVNWLLIRRKRDNN